MPAASLLTLLDDIASVLDDVASMTKVAAKKTAGVLGDDLALNAQQVGGVKADRELPVVWAVARGSLLNKAILVPLALAISAFIPWAVTPLLMIGGAYLSFEGAEKVFHSLLHPPKNKIKKKKNQKKSSVAKPQPAESEKSKIKGAIRTDFILSAEIIVIALGTVAASPIPKQVAVLVGVALLMTIGVYGLVAGIVKLDDAGLFLATRKGKTRLVRILRALGRATLFLAPQLLKWLSIVGTGAMFLVGGSILLHGLSPVNAWLHHLTESVRVPLMGRLVGVFIELATGALVGVVLLLLVRRQHLFRP